MKKNDKAALHRLVVEARKLLTQRRWTEALAAIDRGCASEFEGFNDFEATQLRGSYEVLTRLARD